MCGIIGIYNYFNNNRIINETYSGLKKLQHRGRDSYGFYFTDLKNNFLLKELNQIDVPKINNDEMIKISLGHNKYTTSKARKEIQNMKLVTQPFKGINKRLGEFYLIHNGNINNLDKVKEIFDLENEEFLNDSHMISKIIEKLELQRWEDVFNQIILSIEGSFSIIVSANDKMYAFKDIRAYRPLCYGKNENGYCFASESVGLGDYNYVDEVQRGEIITIDNNGLNKYEIFVDLGIIKSKKCLFETIYFLNKDTLYTINNKQEKIESIRYKYGIELAKNETNKICYENSLVIGAPSTGIPSGKGFADFLKLEYVQILEKNKNTGRSFILKNTEERLKECKRKFNINNGEYMKDKEIYFIDDSLVRGNTLNVIIDLLKMYKPKKIHIRISSPKVLNICNYGIDIPSKEELIMNYHDEESYSKLMSIDSINFLGINNLMKVLGNSDYCKECFTKNYKNDW